VPAGRPDEGAAVFPELWPYTTAARRFVAENSTSHEARKEPKCKAEIDRPGHIPLASPAFFMIYVPFVVEILGPEEPQRAQRECNNRSPEQCSAGARSAFFVIFVVEILFDSRCRPSR
jgi:hypothetical protein